MITAASAQAAPETHTQIVSYQNETVTMRLERIDLRGANFELWAHNASGTYDVITPVAERSYLGTVDEVPGAVSYGVLQDDGTFRGGIIFDRGEGWWTLGSAVTKVRGEVAPSSFGFPAYTVGAGQGGSTTYGFDLGIDARYNYYNVRGGNSIAKTFEHIEYSVAGMRALYMSNALLRPYLARVIIRTDETRDPAYGTGAPGSAGPYLDALRTEWNTNHAGALRDVVAGVSSNSAGGGLAWVGVIGTNSAYSINDSDEDGDFSIVARHEIGHNWGLSHYDGGAPEGATINSGNAYGRFSGPELKKALDHRNTKLGILDNEGTFSAVNLPPYASIDGAILTQVVDSSVQIAVMANDHDANGHSLSLTSFDSVTSRGGSVTQSGQNLVYTPPTGAFLGADTFTYVITDSSGQTATGVVAVDVQPDHSLRMYLPMDDSSGTTLRNLSSFGGDASFADNDLSFSTVPGRFGNAVDFDGVGDYASVSGLNLTTNTVTLTAWIKPAAVQNDFTGIIFDRSGSNGMGLNIQSNRSLRYHWGAGANYAWDSGLIVPADTWTFVALVIEPNQATIHMNTGSGFQSASHTATHAADTFGTTYIGADPTFSSRRFHGAIDDVRMVDRAMSQAELQDVFQGGAANSPRPVDGGTGATSRTLTWAPGAAAIRNQVYVGNDQSGVSTATPSDPEYKGSTGDSVFQANLADNTTYYWRVDTVTASGTLTGPVWTFATGVIDQPSFPLRLYLPMEETSGTTLSNLGLDGSDASFQNNDLSSSTVTGVFGNAVDFDGTNDYASVTGMNFTTNTVTLTAWIKPASLQKDYSGIVFDNSGTNMLGLNIQSNRALRYHWGGLSVWAWDSGLIAPADAWTFVALVIEPDRATIYMNTGSGFVSATNMAGHELDTFTSPQVGQVTRWGTGRRFDGSIDDVRIYEGAMPEADLLMVFGGGPAANPRPVAGATDVIDSELSWLPGAGATSNQVYFGVNKASVTLATPSDPEYKGVTAGSTYPASLADNTTYYWRVDTVTASTTIPGVIWSFTTGIQPVNDYPPVVNAGPDQTVAISGRTAWTPEGITAVAAWYDASDALTITQSGGAVSEWADKSGKGNHAAQGTALNRPSYLASDPLVHNMPSIGNSVLAGSIGLNTPSMTARNVYVVSYYNTGSETTFSGYPTLFSGPGTNGAYRVMGNQNSANFIETSQFNDTGTFKNGSSVSSVIALPMSASVYKFKSSAPRTQAYSLGFNVSFAGRNWQGQYSEWIFTDGTEDLATEQKFEGYLAHKWGLAANLPGDHPYKAAAPGGAGVSVELNGTVSDPDGNPLTTTWSKVSGEGSVLFANSSEVDTTATFSAAGIYVLRLTADDGVFQSSDEVTITVLDEGAFVDSDGDGIDDAWEIAHFGDLTRDGTGDFDGDGVSDFFEYLYGSDPTDAMDRGFALSIAQAVPGEDPVIVWELRDGLTLGVDVEIHVSTDLITWDPLPSEHYSLHTGEPSGGKTRQELTLTHNYGDRVFLRLQKP